MEISGTLLSVQYKQLDFPEQEGGLQVAKSLLLTGTHTEARLL